ncbi:MAG: hypothetical protein SXG53_27640, partial [Pseudomonadota bacterium]|nr:hypothetical protein [Pseudomonadota bacterium]
MHQLGGHALCIIHLAAIEFLQLGQAALGLLDAFQGIGPGARRELLLEAALLLAGEVARAGGEVRIGAHPFIGEAGEEAVDRRAAGRGIGLGRRLAREQVTVTNTGNRSKRFDTSFAQATSAGGATVTTSPASLTVPAGDSRTVTLTLTVDPATLERELDPTSEPTYDLGIPVPRDYVATISGRLVLTPSGGDDPALRVPVHAAPRPVSELTAEPVTFPAEAQEAPLTLTGRGVDGGGWTSLVAPFTLMASSP